MTTHPTDDSLPRDPRFDAAWRAASNEQPPPALDAAIIAAAHREVGAKPQSVSAQAAMRARRRWWPLAAAATVAVIAIGVVQRAGHDDLVAPPSGSTVVSDMPAPSAKSPAESRERAAEAQPRAAPSATASLPKKPEPRSAAAAPSEKKSESTANAPAALPEPFPAAKTRLDAAAARDAIAGAAPSASAGNVQPAERQESAASAKLVAPSTPPSPTSTPPPPPMTPSPAPAMPPAAPSPPMQVAPSFAESGRVAAPATARSSPTAKSTLSGAAEEARIKDRAPLPVADWIALIRRLRTEGNTAEAARELAAFRTAHADHEKLLPPDLRDWHPAEQ